MKNFLPCVLVFPCVLSQNRQGNLVHTRKFWFPVVSKRDVILIYFPLEPKWEINSFNFHKYEHEYILKIKKVK
jgi:hypothetical protein